MSSPNRLLHSLIGFFFKHLYTTIAWAYDLVAFTTSIGQWSNWQRVGTEELSPGRTLEIGHGTGRVFYELCSEGSEIFGIDASRQMTKITARRLKNSNYPISLCQAKAQDLPFPNKSFQSLLATFPSEFIFEAETLREAWRVLKPGGEFIVIPGISKIHGWKRNRNFFSVLDEVASLLYRLTGEAIGTNNDWMKTFKERIHEFGFDVDIEFVQQDRATVLRMIARKPNLVG